MRFYTKQHQYYCGIDLHARWMYLCILDEAAEVRVHRNMKAAPQPFLNAIAPFREGLHQGSPRQLPRHASYWRVLGLHSCPPQYEYTW